MVVMGMASAQMNNFNHPLWISSFSWSTFVVFLGLTSVCSSTFIINQISDEKSDAINKKLFLSSCIQKFHLWIEIFKIMI